MRINNIAKLGFVIGTLFIFTGAFLPSTVLAELLISPPALVSNQLLLGVTIFKICLAVLGISIIVVIALPIWKPGISSHESHLDPNHKLVLFALSIILLLATILRLYELNSGLWLDEILTNVLFARLPFGSIVTTYESENQHFLYSLLAHASFQMFGESAWSLRLPAVLFGVGSIWVLFLLGRDVAGAREGLLSATLLTLSYTHIWFSQNARGYSGLLFWTILSSWLLLRALRESKPQLWLLYAVASALGVYTHVTMIFVILGQFAVYLWTVIPNRARTRDDVWIGFFLGFGFAGLVTLQLYALVLPQLLGGMGREASVVAEWKNPLWTALEIARGMQVSFNGSLIAIAALVVFGAGFVSFVRARFEVILLLVIPSISGALTVIVLGHHLWPRFFFFAMGFGVLIVIRGAMVLGQLGAQVIKFPVTKSVWLGTGLCTALICASAISVPFAYGPKQDYLSALNFVEANQEPGDVVVTTGLAVFPYKEFYHADWEEVETIASLNSIRSRAKRTWLVYTFPTVLNSVSPEIITSIERDFQVVAEFNGTVGDGTIFVVRSDTPPPEPVGP